MGNQTSYQRSPPDHDLDPNYDSQQRESSADTNSTSTDAILNSIQARFRNTANGVNEQDSMADSNLPAGENLMVDVPYTDEWQSSIQGVNTAEEQLVSHQQIGHSADEEDQFPDQQNGSNDDDYSFSDSLEAVEELDTDWVERTTQRTGGYCNLEIKERLQQQYNEMQNPIHEDINPSSDLTLTNNPDAIRFHNVQNYLWLSESSDIRPCVREVFQDLPDVFDENYVFVSSNKFKHKSRGFGGTTGDDLLKEIQAELRKLENGPKIYMRAFVKTCAENSLRIIRELHNGVWYWVVVVHESHNDGALHPRTMVAMTGGTAGPLQDCAQYFRLSYTQNAQNDPAKIVLQFPCNGKMWAGRMALIGRPHQTSISVLHHQIVMMVPQADYSTQEELIAALKATLRLRQRIWLLFPEEPTSKQMCDALQIVANRLAEKEEANRKPDPNSAKKTSQKALESMKNQKPNSAKDYVQQSTHFREYGIGGNSPLDVDVKNEKGHEWRTSKQKKSLDEYGKRMKKMPTVNKNDGLKLQVTDLSEFANLTCKDFGCENCRKVEKCFKPKWIKKYVEAESLKKRTAMRNERQQQIRCHFEWRFLEDGSVKKVSKMDAKALFKRARAEAQILKNKKRKSEILKQANKRRK